MSIIFIDQRMPSPAKQKLSEFGQVMEFMTSDLVYPSISGHPDIFFTPVGKSVVMAPNAPDKYGSILREHGYSIVTGELPVGEKYPNTARYNVVVTDNYLIHNFRHTDSVITDLAGRPGLIHVSQGYTRCNLIGLKENYFITSDEKVHRILSHLDLETLLVQPEGILLEGHNYGFFGGTCGVLDDKFFLAGKLEYFRDGEKVRLFLERIGYEIVELYDGPLFDGGGIIFTG